MIRNLFKNFKREVWHVYTLDSQDINNDVQTAQIAPKVRWASLGTPCTDQSRGGLTSNCWSKNPYPNPFSVQLGGAADVSGAVE